MSWTLASCGEGRERMRQRRLRRLESVLCLVALSASPGRAQMTPAPATAPAPGTLARTCNRKDFKLTGGCPGITIVAQGCFAGEGELNQCSEQLFKTVDATITPDFCYRSFERHCKALQTTVENKKGQCSPWCQAFQQNQPVGCPSADPPSAAGCTSDVALFNVKNPFYSATVPVCPAVTDPAFYTGMETRMCCFQLKKLLKQNCKYVPCEQLQGYIDTVQAAGGCSTASNCVDLRNFVDLSIVGNIFTRLKQKYRSCLMNPSGDPEVQPVLRPANCTRANATVASGICKGYVLGWQACIDDGYCGQAVANEVGNTFTESMCEDLLQNLCASVGGRPRCQASCSFMCETLVTNVWPPQCSGNIDCAKPKFTASSSETVAPLCCSSLRRSITSNCEQVNMALLDAYMDSATEKGIPATSPEAQASTQSCNVSNCIDAPICSKVTFPQKYVKDEIFCSMLHEKSFLNQALVENPVRWDMNLKYNFEKITSDVYAKTEKCAQAYKLWMCSYFARPCAMEKSEPTNTCMDFCLNYMKCNSTIYGMIESMKKNEPVYATMSEQDVLSTATSRICEELGVSPNYNKVDTCFNGIELQGARKFSAAMRGRHNASLVWVLSLLLGRVYSGGGKW